MSKKGATTDIRISHLERKSLAPKVPAEFQHLLPTVFSPESFSLELHGINVAVGNALRRIIMGGIPVFCLDFDMGTLRTNDEFVLEDLLRTRINLIPISQRIDPGLTFSISASNPTESILSIKSISIDIKGGKGGKKEKLFNETFDIVDIAPSRSLTIPEIRPIRGYGNENARHVCAFRAALIPLDQIPFDQFTGTGVPSALSDPRSHRLSFCTNGNVDPKWVLETACSEILGIVERARKYIPSVQTQDGLSSVAFEGFDDTLGNLLLKTAYDVYTSGDFRYGIDELGGRVMFDLRTDEDPAIILGAVFSEIRIIFERIRVLIKELK